MGSMTNTQLVKDEELLKADDVARLLNISKPMAYRLMQRGDIAVIRINTAVRVKPSDLQAYIDRSRSESIAG
jgi:excisionase family DNA binding protein